MPWMHAQHLGLIVATKVQPALWLKYIGADAMYEELVRTWSLPMT